MRNKKFVLIRTYETENEVKGILLIINHLTNGIEFIGKTIENNNTIFPPGKYTIKWEYSPKFQTDLWELKGITGRSEIKIHQGTKWQHSLGCPVMKKTDIDEMHRVMNNIKVTTIKVI